jgi:hypothetical protein
LSYHVRIEGQFFDAGTVEMLSLSISLEKMGNATTVKARGLKESEPLNAV